MKSGGIITVVPCRAASTRLSRKALRPIFGIPSVERCLLNTLAIPSSRATVLATTQNPDDDELARCTLGGRVDVVRGSSDDVLERFITAMDRHQPDFVIRATGDCPAVSYEMAEILVHEHIKSGADVTHPLPGFAVGTNSEVYSAGALRRLRQLVPQALFSEYLIFYFTENTELFTVNSVRLPDSFNREWRVTLDEQSDLNLLERLYAYGRVGSRPLAFRELVWFFEANPDAAGINAANRLKYVHDPEFVAQLRRATRIEVPASSLRRSPA